ncbi:hypothetical protein MMC28_011219, partial [Mycoblastus sanguinarius]|nr:hypothetical protein [Mycoblastus sanguinarius]
MSGLAALLNGNLRHPRRATTPPPPAPVPPPRTPSPQIIDLEDSINAPFNAPTRRRDMNPEQLQLARELEEFQAYERERFGLHRGQGQGQGGIGEQWLREIQGPAPEQIAALPAPDGQIALVGQHPLPLHYERAQQIYTRNLAVARRTNLELYRQREPSEHPSDSETEAFGTPPPTDGANQVTYRDRVRMHTFASLGISPRRI